MKLKWSQYNIFYKSKDEEFTILTNSLTNNVYKLKNDFIEKIEIFLITGVIEDDLKKYISELYIDNFLVDDSLDESQMFKLLQEKEKGNINVGNVYFIPSFDCDFRCSYCILGKNVDTSSFDRMTKTNVIKTAEWLYDCANNLNIKTLQILLFGGEPMLSHKENLLLMDELNGRNNSIQIKYSLITNGYLLSPELLEDLISRNLSSVQITLDGPEKIHDSRRRYIDGSGTFKKIINNLMKIIQYDIQIIIRINVDEENSTYIIELIEYLYTLNLNKRVLLHIVPVDPSSYSSISGYTLNALKAYDSIYQVAFEKNFNVQKWKRFCSISSKMNFSINSSGDVYPCPNYVGNKDYKIADINNGFTDNYYDFFQKKLDDSCVKCKYVGICNGGCLNMKQLANTNKCIFFQANYLIDKSYTLAKYSSNNLDNLRLGNLVYSAMHTKK